MTQQKLEQSRQNDQRLQQRLMSGDQSAMKEIYDAYSGAIFHFARNYLADQNDASDIVHETMMEVWRSAKKFEGRSSLKSWMFSIARNKSIDRNRKGGRLQYTDEVPEVEDTATSAQDVVEISEDAELVRRCVEELPPAHRKIIHLVFFQGLGYQEISELENIPVGTVKTRVLHAKKKLAHILAQQGRQTF